MMSRSFARRYRCRSGHSARRRPAILSDLRAQPYKDFFSISAPPSQNHFVRTFPPMRPTRARSISDGLKQMGKYELNARNQAAAQPRHEYVHAVGAHGIDAAASSRRESARSRDA